MIPRFSPLQGLPLRSKKFPIENNGFRRRILFDGIHLSFDVVPFEAYALIIVENVEGDGA
jgi:hypothetical protein